MADIARIEERLDRVAVGNTEVSDNLGGIAFQNMTEVMEFAKLMSLSGNAVPKHLQGNPGMCLAVCVQAMEWRFSPFAVANKSYEVQNRLSFESQLVHAVIEQRAPIVGRMRHRFEGEGDERVCIVWATLRETSEVLEYRSPPFNKIQPKNSPLWKTKPDLQQYYNTSRDFCRAYFPDVLLGVYTKEELNDHVGPDNAKDVSARPSVGDRLKGNKGRGFNASHVERETRGGVIENGNPHDDEAPAVAATGDGQRSEALESNLANATNTNSSQAVSPSAPTETDTPAADDPPDRAAGTPSELPEEASEGTGNGEDRSGDDSSSAAPAPSLPEGWPITYAAALRRAQKPESLSKYATQYWAQYGGWAKHKEGPNGPTAIAIYDVFQNNFGRKDVIDDQLRELL